MDSDNNGGMNAEFSIISLTEIVNDLESQPDRNSEEYGETMEGLAKILNGLSRGALKGIDGDELRGQAGNLLYFQIKDVAKPIPFDIEFINLLKSHFRNPTILVLRRIRKFLMPRHRNLLARLEEDQHRERQIRFQGLDIDRKVKTNLNEMQRFQTMAQLTRSVTRKLDILARAVCVPRQSKLEFRLLNGILDDQHHLRHANAMDWLDKGSCRGDVGFMNRIIEKGMWVLDRKSEKIRDDLEKLSGLPFSDNDTIAANGNWFSLTTPVRRGEDFLSIFNAEEQTEMQIKQITFFVIQSAYHVGKFQKMVDDLSPENLTTEGYVSALSGIYFEIERCIQESVKKDGEAMAAITSDLKFNRLTAKEAEDAKTWVASNRMKLQSLKLEIFSQLLEFHQDHPEAALPQRLEHQVETEREQMEEEPEDKLIGDILPKIPVKAMEAELEQYLEESNNADGALLEALCEFIDKVLAWRDHLSEMEYHRKLRDLSDDFQEYEGYLMRFQKLEEALETLRTRALTLVERVYHSVYLGDVPEPILKRSFEFVLDLILQKVRLLEYEVLDAERYQAIFERALDLEGQAAYVQLDQLFRELHALPRQSQLIQALADWEHELDKEAMTEKQGFIVENEFQLQELLDQVRGELRERMTEERINSRRLRFDVFSLGDCYAGNLEIALEALLRTIPTLASDQEGESLLEQLQALEGQVIEAQRVTRPKGEAFRKLRDLERTKLMPTTFLEDLRQDLEENFTDLDTLLERINEELRELRKLQNRFGGNHDTAVFSLAINYYDLEQLKKIYSFVENITMMDLKRFGVVYTHKNAMMEDLLKRALAKDPSVPEEVGKRVSRRIFKAFKESKNIPMDLKIVVLVELPEILESESELLVRTLNFVDHEVVGQKAIYQGLLQIMSQCKEANPTTLGQLKKIWIHYMSRINGFQPVHYLKNYELNKRMLIADARKEIGNKFK